MATTIRARPKREAFPFGLLALPRPVFQEPPTRRLVNVLAALSLLALAAPLMIVIAVLVKLTSSGPAFYTQIRIGIDLRGLRRGGGYGRRWNDLGGKPFTIYKFRTMCVGNGGADPQVWAAEGDVRVTRIGRLLRNYRLDELPQLFNVLLGDMNLVGPRPEQPTIFARLADEITEYRRRQLVRPGLTGWAQVNQGYDHSIDDVRRKVALDLEYIDRQSAAEDLRIMARTVPVMLFGRGSC
jgi:lipopolysaccharide/colanic/teichoic acid biosynthesis glycosyltransferase